MYVPHPSAVPHQASPRASASPANRASKSVRAEGGGRSTQSRVAARCRPVNHDRSFRPDRPANGAHRQEDRPSPTGRAGKMSPKFRMADDVEALLIVSGEAPSKSSCDDLPVHGPLLTPSSRRSPKGRRRRDDSSHRSRSRPCNRRMGPKKRRSSPCASRRPPVWQWLRCSLRDGSTGLRR